jgi:hypothetical protein
MEKEEIKIQGGKILYNLFEKYKNEPWVLTSSEIVKKKNSFFSGKWGEHNFYRSKQEFALISGIALEGGNDGWSGTVWFLIDSEDSHFEFIWNSTLIEINKKFEILNSNSIKVGLYSRNILRITEPEIQFLQEFLDTFSLEVDKEFECIQNEEKKTKEKEKQQLELLKKSKTSFLEEFDQDSNGVIDVIEGSDDFMILFKKHQKKVIEVDKQFIQNFVKVSNYLKTKKQNIQDVFSSIKKTENQTQLDDNVGILKNQIHTYELLLFHSLNMIISIVEDDLITFYEIYESFDKLNIFNSNWENEVSEQLKNLEVVLSDLMYSINSMEKNIVNGLNELSYVTQEGFSELEQSVTKELQSIDSSIKFNNLLTGISVYQLYKINKQTKGLNK